MDESSFVTTIKFIICY